MAVEFPEHLVEEFLLRLPPADPASLVRAALVSKPWCRLVSAPRFRRRFREFHRTPPVLGFVANTTKAGHDSCTARFVSTSSFRAAAAEHRGWLVLDARHGRVLLRSIGPEIRPRLAVWDPVTDEWRQVPEVASLPATGWNAAVFCRFESTGSCDHLDCQRGPFFVVLVAESTFRVYRSDAGTWSGTLPIPQCYVNVAPTALAEDTLYFLIDMGRTVFGCNQDTGETFLAHLPPDSDECDPVLMTMEDGRLGVALGQGTRLSLWSMVVDTGAHRDIGWAQVRVIELDKLLPVTASSIYPTPVGFFPGVFFFNTDDGLFSINLISGQVKKELENGGTCVIKVVPYMSFYTPAPGLTIADEEPAVDGTGA